MYLFGKPGDFMLVDLNGLPDMPAVNSRAIVQRCHVVSKAFNSPTLVGHTADIKKYDPRQLIVRVEGVKDDDKDLLDFEEFLDEEMGDTRYMVELL